MMMDYEISYYTYIMFLFNSCSVSYCIHTLDLFYYHLVCSFNFFSHAAKNKKTHAKKFHKVKTNVTERLKIKSMIHHNCLKRERANLPSSNFLNLLFCSLID